MQSTEAKPQPQYLWAWVTEGENGFTSVKAAGARYPLVAATYRNAVAMKKYAHEAAQASGKPVKLIRFERAETIDRINPHD